MVRERKIGGFTERMWDTQEVPENCWSRFLVNRQTRLLLAATLTHMLKENGIANERILSIIDNVRDFADGKISSVRAQMLSIECSGHLEHEDKELSLISSAVGSCFGNAECLDNARVPMFMLPPNPSLCSYAERNYSPRRNTLSACCGWSPEEGVGCLHEQTSPQRA